jgi:CheY-like chemotaxis protein
VTLTVLVVDDDADFLSLAARLLKQLGVAEIVTATDAASAIAKAATTRPEAMLVDIGLPDRDGIDLAQELAALPWSPRVVLTSIDRDPWGGMEDPDRDGRLAFVPKDELANGGLRRLLLDP